MKVLTEEAVRFVDGEVLAPEHLNKVFLYAADAVDDVAERRFAKAVVVIPFVVDTAAGYTNASGSLLSYKWQAPVAVTVERCFVSANLVTASGVTLSVTKTSDASTPDGATVPLLSLPITASATTDVDDSSQDRFVLAENVEYAFTLAGSSFTTSRLDLILHVVVDRWTLASSASDVPSFDPTLFTDASAPNANLVGANQSTLLVQALKFGVSKGVVPTFFVRASFNNATSANLLNFTLPRMHVSRADQTVIRLYCWAEMAGTGGTTVVATLRDASATVLATATANVAGVSSAMGDSGVVNVNMASATTGVTATTASDYSVRLAAGNAVVCNRAHVLVWTEWR